MAQSTPIRSMEFVINRSWNDEPRKYSIEIKLSRENDEDDFVTLEINAPFFNNSLPPSLPGEPFPQLHNYEVVKTFFLGEDKMYLEVELGPRGQHLVVFVTGSKDIFKFGLPLKYTTKVKGFKWYGKAQIPVEYFPPNVTRFNAIAVHNEDEEARGSDDEEISDLEAEDSKPSNLNAKDSKPSNVDAEDAELSDSSSGLTVDIKEFRIFDALYPDTTGLTDDPRLHHLSFFQPIDFKSLVKDNTNNQLSNEWKFALEDAGFGYDKTLFQAPGNSMDFTINRSWDDDPRDYSVNINLRRGRNYVIMEVNAPFFDSENPGGKPGEPFPKLWELEVVEAFFLGEDNMYLEVELSPFGQHLVLFLAGLKNPIKMLLPLKYRAKIYGDKWYGKALIPFGYFPPNVTLFNAYAIHGEKDKREYDALYPAPSGCYNDPDFHRLHLFKRIDFDSLIKRDKQLSQEWKSALDQAGIEFEEKSLNSPEKTLEFRINTDWQGNPVKNSGGKIKLRQKGSFVVMDILAPFYVGRKPDSKPFIKLWKYEVVRAFFLGSSSMYLEVECSPYGQYLVILLAGPKNIIKTSLTMEYNAEINGSFWTGKAKIPARYFPPRCSMFNAYSVYGSKNDRKVDALFPAEKFRHLNPDLHWFHYFRIINFKMLLKRKNDFSNVWKKALAEAGIRFKEKEFYVPNSLSYETEPRIFNEDDMDKMYSTNA